MHASITPDPEAYIRSLYARVFPGTPMLGFFDAAGKSVTLDAAKPEQLNRFVPIAEAECRAAMSAQP